MTNKPKNWREGKTLKEKFHIFFVSIGGGTTLNSEEEVVAQYSKIWEWIAEQIKKAKQEGRTNFRYALYKLDWIKILDRAIKARQTSWGKDIVSEWRNASDEIMMAVITELEQRKIIPSNKDLLKPKSKTLKKGE